MRDDWAMTRSFDILCIGAAHWDVIGHSPLRLTPGDDVPGSIHQSPGGVALTLARVLTRLGHRAALLSAVGQDAEGAALVAQMQADGIDTSLLHRPEGMRTDRYLAIEGAQGLLAAIADSATLEQAGAAVLAPLKDDNFGRWQGTVVMDSGLPQDVLASLAASDLLDGADLRLTASAPAKAHRLGGFLSRGRATLYLNLGEAEALLTHVFPDSLSAAEALVKAGAARAIVTDGARAVTDAHYARAITQIPPMAAVERVTGAGDVFMASHIAAEARGLERDAALDAALTAAARHIATFET